MKILVKQQVDDSQLFGPKPASTAIIMGFINSDENISFKSAI